MPEGKKPLKTIIWEILPLESLYASIEVLSNKEWARFFRLFTILGLIILSFGILITAVLFIIRPVFHATGILSMIWTLISQAVLAVIVIFLFSLIVSQPLDEVTGAIEPLEFEELDLHPLYSYSFGLIGIGMALVFRYGIAVTPVFVELPLSRIVGRFIGTVISDFIYFGLLMFSGGVFLHTYFRDTKHRVSNENPTKE